MALQGTQETTNYVCCNGRKSSQVHVLRDQFPIQLDNSIAKLIEKVSQCKTAMMDFLQ